MKQLTELWNTYKQKAGEDWAKIPCIALLSVGTLGVLYMLSRTSMSTNMQAAAPIIELPQGIIAAFPTRSGPSLSI